MAGVVQGSEPSDKRLQRGGGTPGIGVNLDESDYKVRSTAADSVAEFGRSVIRHLAHSSSSYMGEFEETERTIFESTAMGTG